MESVSRSESDVKSWLEVVLKKENLKNISVNILGNTEKGDGYIGDVIFVDASGTMNDGSERHYKLVLKCSKRSQALREQFAAHEIFVNEIYIYDIVLPAFTKFQLEKGVANYFDSVPKYYGSYIGDNVEVIVFDNLRELGYKLWDKKIPLSRNHINTVVQEYGKFHATSIAFQRQYPDVFQKFLKHFERIFVQFAKKGNMIPVVNGAIEEVYDLLKGELETGTLKKWKKFKEQTTFIFGELLEKADVKVIVHGDCWNNNFMYSYDESDLPKKVAILDWQVSRFSLPIQDLSYFIFTCISEDDLEDMKNILGNYYKSFSEHLRKLGVDPKSVYTFDQFLEDWRKYCKCGILMTSVIFKVCSTEKDEVVDMGEAADKGAVFESTFGHEIKNKNVLKSRAKPIVEYAVKHDLI